MSGKPIADNSISEWENIIRKYADLKLLEQDSSKKKPATGAYTIGDFAGILASDRADALLKHVQQSRRAQIDLQKCIRF